DRRSSRDQCGAPGAQCFFASGRGWGGGPSAIAAVDPRGSGWRSPLVLWRGLRRVVQDDDRFRRPDGPRPLPRPWRRRLPLAGADRWGVLMNTPAQVSEIQTTLQEIPIDS